MANDKNCLQFKENKEIKKIAVDKNLSFPNASMAWNINKQATETGHTANHKPETDHASTGNKQLTGREEVARYMPELLLRLYENTQLVNHYLLSILFRVPQAFEAGEAVNIHSIIHPQLSLNDEIFLKNATSFRKRITLKQFKASRLCTNIKIDVMTIR